MKEKFNEILNEYGIFGYDAETILDAVCCMLNYVMEEEKKKIIPHTIIGRYSEDNVKRLYAAAIEIFYLKKEL